MRSPNLGSDLSTLLTNLTNPVRPGPHGIIPLKGLTSNTTADIVHLPAPLQLSLMTKPISEEIGYVAVLAQSAEQLPILAPGAVSAVSRRVMETGGRDAAGEVFGGEAALAGEAHELGALLLEVRLLAVGDPRGGLEAGVVVAVCVAVGEVAPEADLEL